MARHVLEQQAAAGAAPPANHYALYFREGRLRWLSPEGDEVTARDTGLITNADVAPGAGIDGAKLAAGSVTGEQLAGSVAGAGLVGGAGSPLAVNPDGTTLEVAGDQLRVKDGGITAGKIANRTRWATMAMAPTGAGVLTGWSGPVVILGDSGTPGVQFGLAVPPDYVPETAVTVRVRVICAATGQVNLRRWVTCTPVGSAADWDVESAVNFNHDPGAANRVEELALSLNSALIQAGRYLGVRVERLVADPNTGDVRLGVARLEYTADS